MKKQKVDPNTAIDIATSLIPDTKPKTVVDKVFRWLKGANKVKNALGIEIKKRSN